MNKQTFLNVKQVANRLAVSVPTVWRWSKAGQMPHAIKLSPGCTRWRVADLEKWESEQKESV